MIQIGMALQSKKYLRNAGCFARASTHFLCCQKLFISRHTKAVTYIKLIWDEFVNIYIGKPGNRRKY